MDNENVIENAVIRYGGTYISEGYGYYGCYGCSYYSAVRFTAASPAVQKNTIALNHYGLLTNKGSQPTLLNNVIFANQDYGLFNEDTTITITAQNNWWGHPAGPFHPDTNPDGLGNRVSNNIIYDPWLVASSGFRQPIPLTVGQPITGYVKQNDYLDYSINILSGQSIVIEVAPNSANDTLWAFGRQSDLPLWTRFDLRTQQRTARGTYELLISPQQAGTYFVSVFGHGVSSVDGRFRIQAKSTSQYVSDVAPRNSGNAGGITLKLTGLGFVDGIQVKLKRTGVADLLADVVTVESPTTLWAHINLQNASIGAYEIETNWPNGQQVKLSGSFSVSAGIGARLETKLVGPDTIRAGRSYVVRLEYKNTGDADMPAPFINISSDVAGTLFNSGGISATDSLIWIAAAEGSPGDVLGPGQQGSVSFQVSARQSVNLSVGQVVEDQVPFDWSAIELRLRPSDVSLAEWQTIWTSATIQIGTTRAQVFQTLRKLNTGHAGSAEFDQLLRLAIFVAHEKGSQTVNSSGEMGTGINSPEFVKDWDPSTDVQLLDASGNTLSLATFDPTKPTIFITHGGRFNGARVTNLSQCFRDEGCLKRISDLALAKVDYFLHHNIVLIAWPNGAALSSDLACGLDAAADCLHVVSRRIPVVGEIILKKLKELNYSRWSDSIYDGESFGNAVNAYISKHAPQKGLALILDAAQEAGFDSSVIPEYVNSFRNSIAIQTKSFFDTQTMVGHYTIFRDAVCGQHSCNAWGDSHTAQIAWLTSLLKSNDLKLREFGIALDEVRVPAGSESSNYDGCIDQQNVLHTSLENFVLACKVLGQLPKKVITAVPKLLVRGIALVAAVDPNDKVGNSGAGSNHIVASQDVLNYTINFENRSSATAPVQELLVVDTLDSNLDWTTLQLMDISFGKDILTIPSGQFEYSTRIYPALSSIAGTVQGKMAIDAAVSLNPTTGRIEWRLKAIDTATGQPPEDPFAGFVPPENGTGRGQGHVSFLIKPKSDLAVGARIANTASITFDTNAPLATNEVWNTIGTPNRTVFLPLVRR